MTGDLSITPQQTSRDLAAGARGTPAPLARPSPPDGAVSTPAALRQDAAADASQQVEVAHLRTLLTDPAMRVSTHHDEVSGRTVLEVQSRATGEVLEQIPSEALLQLYAAMRASLVDERA
jgi:FlaG protein